MLYLIRDCVGILQRKPNTANMKFSSFYYKLDRIGYERDFNDTKMSVLKLLFSEVIQHASTNNLLYSLLINQQAFNISWGENHQLHQRAKTSKCYSKCHHIDINMQTQISLYQTVAIICMIFQILFLISNIIHMLLKI